MDIISETKKVAEVLGEGWEFKTGHTVLYGQNPHYIQKSNTIVRLFHDTKLWIATVDGFQSAVNNDPALALKEAIEKTKVRLEKISEELSVIS